MWLLRLLGIGKPVFLAVAVTSIAAAVAVEACPAPPPAKVSASTLVAAPDFQSFPLPLHVDAVPSSPAAVAPANYVPDALTSAPVAARTVLKVAPKQAVPKKAAPRKAAPKKVTPKKVVKPAPKKAAPKPAAQSAPVSALAQAMLARINAERAQNGRAALRMNGSLVASAHNHNLAMAGANAMSHQLPGEAALQGRLAAVGYNWSAAGENVGWNSDASADGMFNLDQQMMAEVAPNDGHRVNLLNARYTEIGIDVYIDPATGKLWLTEDFGQPR